MLVGACRTVVDEFRAAVAAESVRAVFKANKGKLSALFRRYAGLEPSTASSGSHAPAPAASSASASGVSSESSFVMSWSHFLLLLRDLGLVEGSVSTASTLARRRSLEPAQRVASPPPPSSSPQQQSAPQAVIQHSEARLRLLFQNAQHDDEYGLDAHESSSDAASAAAQQRSVSYVEWLECLAALACWSTPDPFVPLPAKLDSFLTHTVFASLKRGGAAR